MNELIIFFLMLVAACALWNIVKVVAKIILIVLFVAIVLRVGESIGDKIYGETQKEDTYYNVLEEPIKESITENS